MKNLGSSGYRVTKDLMLCRVGNYVAVMNTQTHSVVILGLEYDPVNNVVDVDKALEAYFTRIGRAHTNSPELIVRYHRTWPKWGAKHPSVLTIAARIDYNNSTLDFGWSLCSQQDNFSKTRGRELALARLDQTPETIQYDPAKSIIQNVEFAVTVDHYSDIDKILGRDWDKLANHFFGC